MNEGKCYACGGMVDANGMAEGGEVEAPSGENMVPDDAVNADGETTQMMGADEADRNAAKSFIRAVRTRR